MSEFVEFKSAVQMQFDALAKYRLFRTNVDKDLLWDTYLSSFPEGTNNIFRERTEHDCSCCKQFIRACGDVVAIIDNKLVSIWDIEIDGHYKIVSTALSKLIKSKGVMDVFYHYENNLGADFNREMLENGEILKWDHFHFKLHNNFVKPKLSIATAMSEARSSKDVFKRALKEISIESINTVIELIDQKSIYRGEEHHAVVSKFLASKVVFDELSTEAEQDNYTWVQSIATNISRIRNSAIGTLLVDISEGMALDKAVASFETKVAPQNYKRPSALITKGMIAKAQKKVADLGIEDALFRRYAVAEDITINNVLFADRSAKKAMNVFEELAEKAPDNLKNLDKVDEVDIDIFVEDILPKAKSVELLFENNHANNLVSLIAPKDKSAKPIFKWDNNFSWSYNGEVTDSIKERVKKAGGNVNGVLRCSLSWFNYDDLDIHVIEPTGTRIHFGRKRSPTSGGVLDVDMNVGANGSRAAVENIVWTNKSKMPEGEYQVFINNYTLREKIDVGFDVEIEFEGDIYRFHYPKQVREKGNVMVAKFNFSRKQGIKFTESLPSTKSSKQLWEIPTEKFRKVSMIMKSPNHWDDKKTGNKHWFFMLEGCKNEQPTRGFFNEFLKDDLIEHRKVFEVLGSKMKTEESDNQLSGLGFSSTKKNHVFCKVDGSFARTIKINF